MKAVIIERHGGPEALTYVEDFEKPEPGTGEVLVRVAATGVNLVDLIVRGGYPGIEIPLPHIPGGDLVGTVESAGSGVEGLETGTRVVGYPLVACGECALCSEGKPNLCLNWKYVGLHLKGTYAEYAVVPAENLFPLTDSISFEAAVSLPVAGLTAYHALVSVGNLKAGETFFMWGGAGGLGMMAVQIAKHLGARVVATAGSAEKVKLMQELGVDLALNRNEDDVAAEVKKFAPAGVDLALDYVGPESFQTTFDLLKKGGTMLLCGIITGRETNLSIHMTYLRHLSIKGLYLGTKEDMVSIIKLVESRVVKPHIGTVYALEDAAAAQDLLASGGSIGKVALRV